MALTKKAIVLCYSLPVPHRKNLTTNTLSVTVQLIERRIYLIRGQKVMIDADLAELYGVPTSRLNEQVSRNKKRFPEDFMFRLTKEEAENLRSQFAISRFNLRSQLQPQVWHMVAAVSAAGVPGIGRDDAFERGVEIAICDLKHPVVV